MKTAIFVSFLLILWGIHNLDLVYSKKVPVSTIIKATSKIIKGTPTLKFPKNLPKLPSVNWGLTKQVLRLRDRVDSTAWKNVEKSINFFKKVKIALENNNITSYDKLPHGWNWNEILWCHPGDDGSRCYSTCQKKGYQFTWCFTSMAQNSWQHCTCTIRPSVRHWIHLAKKRLLEKSQVLAKTSVIKEGKNETIQWIVIAILASLVMILVIGISARVIYNYRRAQYEIPPNIVAVGNIELEGH